MSRPVREFSSDQAPAKDPVRPVMVYVCECGTKWINSTKTAWNCKCGKPLVKRNGIIHSALVSAALDQPSGHSATRLRNIRVAV
jgi:hypothetical protein